MEDRRFGTYLQSIREEKGLTRLDVAIKLNVDKKKVKMWESNKEYPTFDEMYEISELFQVSCKELLELKENEITHSQNIIWKISQVLGISMLLATILLIVILVFFFILAFCLMNNSMKDDELSKNIIWFFYSGYGKLN